MGTNADVIQGIYGTVKRNTPRLRVLRGWDPTRPVMQSAAYRVGDDYTIKSGMVISPVVDGDDIYWAPGIDLEDPNPYIAFKDSGDEDVLAADSLLGLSCSGQFEFLTPYFAGNTFFDDGYTKTYQLGDLVTAYAIGSDNAGRLRMVDSEDADESTYVTVLGQVTNAVGSIDGLSEAHDVVYNEVLGFRTNFIPQHYVVVNANS